MSLETTVFTFKISVPFEEWAAVYDSEENIQMNKEHGIICLFKGVKKDCLPTLYFGKIHKKNLHNLTNSL